MVTLTGSATSALHEGGLRAARPFVQQLVDLLDVHTAVEEEGLFPALAREFGAHVHRLVEDHRAVDQVLQEVLARPGPAPVRGEDTSERGLSRRLVDGFYRLREHILAEQDGAFPAALACLSPEQWSVVDEVGKQVRAGGSGASGMSISRV